MTTLCCVFYISISNKNNVLFVDSLFLFFFFLGGGFIPLYHVELLCSGSADNASLFFR